MRIFLIAGYAGSGKSTAGDIIVRAIGAKTTAFGAAVKDDVAALQNIPRYLLETQEGKRLTYNGKSGRQHLIEHSAAMKRLHGDDVWAVRVAKKIAEFTSCDWVIHDWRYKTELNTLRETFPDAKIITIRVCRSTVIPLDDPSEHDIDDVPTGYVILNDGTKAELEKALTCTYKDLAC